jgi:hypothetical protein
MIVVRVRKGSETLNKPDVRRSNFYKVGVDLVVVGLKIIITGPDVWERLA